jgi:hypothetical protein
MTPDAMHIRRWLQGRRDKRRLKRERTGDTPEKQQERPAPDFRDPTDRLSGTGGPATGGIGQ